MWLSRPAIRLLGTIRHAWLGYSTGVLLSLAARLAMAIVFAVSLNLLTQAVAHGRDTLGAGLWWLALGITLVGLCVPAARYSLETAAQRVCGAVGTETFGRALHRPLAVLDHDDTGEILSRLANDLEKLKGTLASDLPDMLCSVLQAPIAVAWLFTLDAKATGGMLLVAAVSIAGSSFLSGKIRDASRETQAHVAREVQYETDVVSGIEVLKSLGAEGNVRARFSTLTLASLRRKLRLHGLYAGQRAASSLVTKLNLVGIVVMGGYLVVSGQTSPGTVVAVINVNSNAIQPLAWLGYSWAGVQTGIAALERLSALRGLDAGQSPRPRPCPELISLREIDGHPAVSLQGVSFAYCPGMPVLDRVSFTVPKGSITAITGPSGTGKSTVLKLLLGFRQPAGGTVNLLGHDIATLAPEALRSLTSYVPQDVRLFAGTVAENILLGSPAADRQAMVSAARAAGADEFIEQLAEGYDTAVGEKGVGLSGGQRQRIALARAILHGGQVLLLDEPLSAVDAVSASRIRDALRQLVPQRTVLLVSHEPASAEWADNVIHLKGSAKHVR